MRRHRFYAQPDQISNERVQLDREQSHHLARVLRLGIGDEVEVFDGEDHVYRCTVLQIDGGKTKLSIDARLSKSAEAPVRITLAQALVKGEKFDWIVQKATELGVSSIVPLATEHADLRLGADQAARRVERWQRISLEALKQCGRSRLVSFTLPLSPQDYVSSRSPEDGPMLVFTERGGLPLPELLHGQREPERFAVVIGPEGGWGESERSLLQAHNGRFVTLGPRILRTETAAVAALSLLQHLLGDLSVPETPIS
ncbi:MAG: 16S rRNA (uracil(1498)-N(3))-methyltransferase [Acidobacteria bacterium]|nr:16S rRNA (uracil(1498)-N(3))-methyltransferase [Acidobacteriota bacterium]